MPADNRKISKSVGRTAKLFCYLSKLLIMSTKNISSPIKNTKVILENYWKTFSDTQLSNFNKEVRAALSKNNINDVYYNQLINDDIEKKEISNRLAWEYLRRDHFYQNCYYHLKETLKKLKSEIEINPDEYYNNTTIKELCKKNIKHLLNLSLFGFQNPLRAQSPTLNEAPVFLYSKFRENNFVVKYDDEYEEDLKVANSSKNKLPLLYPALYKMDLITKAQKQSLRWDRNNYPYLIGLDISLLHDLDLQLNDIKTIVKNLKKESKATSKNIDIKMHIMYLDLIDKLHDIYEADDWTAEINKIKKQTKVSKSSTFYDHVGKAIFYTHQRGYLDLVGLSYLQGNIYQNHLSAMIDSITEEN
ncbi:MAG: hypothetical protein ACXVNF_00950 [Neobacillus sp.]